MGQLFNLINIDVAVYDWESPTKATLGSGKLGEWFFGPYTAESLIDRLDVPKVRIPEDPLAGQSFLSIDRHRSRHHHGIHTLPRELHQEIFAYLDDYTDAFCFAVTSRYMWTVGIRTLRKLYAPWVLHEHGAWARDRLIIAGNSSEWDDRPLDVFTPWELFCLAEYADEDELSLYGALLEAAGNLTVKCDYEVRRELLQRLGRRGRVPRWMDKLFSAWIRGDSDQNFDYSTDGPKILRCLTKKEYMRSDTLFFPTKYAAYGKLVMLGYVLLSRIVWTSVNSLCMAVSDEFGEKFIRGEWAGCAFDVVGLEVLDGSQEEWKDVTAEVKEDLMYLAEVNEVLTEPEPGAEGS